MTSTQTRTVIQAIAPGHAEIRSGIPYPRLRPDYVIAEPKAFALNPTDNHHINSLAGTGPIIGCDWSGIVREVGDNVTRFKPGDAVFGVCHGGLSYLKPSFITGESKFFTDVLNDRKRGRARRRCICRHYHCEGTRYHA
jgi:NADPH:quinone reductase-like Zn-dependent oxidoreductase